MSDIVGLTEKILGQELEDLHTAAPARIEAYDPVRMVAEITLLYKLQGQNISKIVEVPVSFLKAGPFIIRPPYNTGDIVLVVFSERSLDYILQEVPQDTQSEARHRLDDAIIVHGLKLDSQPNLPDANKEDLLIMNTQAKSKAIMTAAGDIIFEGNNILLGDAATEGIPKGVTLKNWLDNHIHPTLNGNSGAPTTQSPAPSEKVKVK